MYAIRSYYGISYSTFPAAISRNASTIFLLLALFSIKGCPPLYNCLARLAATMAKRNRLGIVITSYSIHYTKLYEEVVLVISNNRDSGALERARNAKIPALCIDHRQFDSREAFDQAVVAALQKAGVELVVSYNFV